MKITWNDLAIDLKGQPSDELLSEWRWMVPSTMNLRMVSSIGDAFLEDENGNIHWLDVGSATISAIAVSRAQFDEMRQQVEFADQWFAPQLVGELMSSGRTLEKNQCFSYKIPLTLGGAFDETNFEPCDVSVHFRTLGQIQKQVNDIPLGSKITSVQIES